MPTAFVAVIRAEQIPPGLAAELAAGLARIGAQDVRALGDLTAMSSLASSSSSSGVSSPDEIIAVVLDPTPAASVRAEEVAAMLATFTAATGSVTGMVMTGVRPVTDTLKQVGPGSALTGTADREHHRVVTAPMATRLGLLRAALEKQPHASTAGEILAALVAVGGTVVAAG